MPCILMQCEHICVQIFYNKLCNSTSEVAIQLVNKGPFQFNSIQLLIEFAITLFVLSRLEKKT